MGRYKGLGMPRAKKKKLDAARARLLEQVSSDAAEIVAPQAVLEPLAALPAAREPTAADVLKAELQDARRKAREASWIAEELQKDVESAKRALNNGKCASGGVIFGTACVQPSHVCLWFKVVFQYI